MFIVRTLKAIRHAADESISLANLGEISDMLDRLDFMAEKAIEITGHLLSLQRRLPEPPESAATGKVSPRKAACLIQRYATEAITGLRSQGSTADTENRLIDIRDLALGIANDPLD